MTVRIEYRLYDAGWADCEVAVDSNVATVQASYLGDALRELIEATLAIVEGSAYSIANFCEEPGECRFVLEPEGDRMRLRILEFSEIWSKEPDEEGTVRFDAVCGQREFAEAVLIAARAVLASHGLQGYLEKWRLHEFPSEAVYKLDRALLGATSH